MIEHEVDKIKNCEPKYTDKISEEIQSSNENKKNRRNEISTKSKISEKENGGHENRKSEIIENAELQERKELNETENVTRDENSKLKQEYKGHNGIKVNSNLDDLVSLDKLNAIDPEELETGLKVLSVCGSTTNENIDGNGQRIASSTVMDVSCSVEGEKTPQEGINFDQYMGTKDVVDTIDDRVSSGQSKEKQVG